MVHPDAPPPVPVLALVEALPPMPVPVLAAVLALEEALPPMPVLELAAVLALVDALVLADVLALAGPPADPPAPVLDVAPPEEQAAATAIVIERMERSGHREAAMRACARGMCDLGKGTAGGSDEGYVGRACRARTGERPPAARIVRRRAGSFAPAERKSFPTAGDDGDSDSERRRLIDRRARLIESTLRLRAVTDGSGR